MLIRKVLAEGEPAVAAVVIVRAAEGVRAAGKFIAGREAGGRGGLVLVFDDTAQFHKDLAVMYGLKAEGGGWMEIDFGRRTAVVSSRSTQYGREPDRVLTVALFESALDGFRVWQEE